MGFSTSVGLGDFKVDVYFRGYSGVWMSSGSMRIGEAGLYLVKINGTTDAPSDAHYDVPLRISNSSANSSGDIFGVQPTPIVDDSSLYYTPNVIDGEFYVRAYYDNMYINWTIGDYKLMRGGVTAVRIGV